MITNEEHQAFLNLRRGWKHKAWGGAKPNPRIGRTTNPACGTADSGTHTNMSFTDHPMPLTVFPKAAAAH